MLVKDLQQILGNFTDKFATGKGMVAGKTNAIGFARVYVDMGNNKLQEIIRIEAQENNIIAAKEGVRLVLKTASNKPKLILQKGVNMELSEEQRKQLLSYMWSKPYGEVAQLIQMLASLTPKKNNSVTPKK